MAWAAWSSQRAARSGVAAWRAVGKMIRGKSVAHAKGVRRMWTVSGLSGSPEKLQHRPQHARLDHTTRQHRAWCSVAYVACALLIMPGAGKGNLHPSCSPTCCELCARQGSPVHALGVRERVDGSHARGCPKQGWVALSTHALALLTPLIATLRPDRVLAGAAGERCKNAVPAGVGTGRAARVPEV